MIKITVSQGDNSVEFMFSSELLGDAMRFVQDCVETAGAGTYITIVEEAE